MSVDQLFEKIRKILRPGPVHPNKGNFANDRTRARLLGRSGGIASAEKRKTA
jgi:general stress protein YciG